MSAITLRIIGQSNERAKVLDWHDETYTIPLALLDTKGRQAIADALGWAQGCTERLYAASVVAYTKLGADQRGAEVRAEKSHALIAFDRAARSEFVSLLASIASGDVPATWLERFYRLRLISVLQSAWAQAVTDLGPGARAERAIANAEGLISSYVSDLIPDALPVPVPFTALVQAQMEAMMTAQPRPNVLYWLGAVLDCGGSIQWIQRKRSAQPILRFSLTHHDPAFVARVREAAQCGNVTNRRGYRSCEWRVEGTAAEHLLSKVQPYMGRPIPPKP